MNNILFTLAIVALLSGRENEASNLTDDQWIYFTGKKDTVRLYYKLIEGDCDYLGHGDMLIL